VAIADLPPPIQGISVVSAWVIQTLRLSGAVVEVRNTSVTQGNNYRSRRILKFLVSYIAVIVSKPNSTVYIALSHGFTLYAQIVIALTCRIKKQRVLVHHHTFLPINDPSILLNRLCHGLIRNFAEHIFLSSLMESAYKEAWNPKGQTWVISNHQVAYLRTRNKFEINRKLGARLCYSGRLSSEKGFWDVVAVTRKMLSSDFGMSASFLGPAGDSHIAEELTNLKKQFSDRFHHIDSYDEHTLTIELQKSTYFLFPSRYSNEASPLVVLEAQALGNICVTTDVGSLCADVIAPGNAFNIRDWPTCASDLIANLNLDLSALAQQSTLISGTSASLSEKCTKQLKEAFRL
jgi:glycosyltransferase involved in cell wall biosynthesis